MNKTDLARMRNALSMNTVAFTFSLFVFLSVSIIIYHY